MNSLNTAANPHLKSQKIRIILLLRWFLGGLVGFGISACIFLDFLNDKNITPLLCAIPFIGQFYLFAYLYLSTLLNGYISQTISYYIIIFSATIWGLIGALLASGQRKQIFTGAILLILYLIVGILSYMVFNLNLMLSA